MTDWIPSGRSRSLLPELAQIDEGLPVSRSAGLARLLHTIRVSFSESDKSPMNLRARGIIFSRDLRGLVETALGLFRIQIKNISNGVPAVLSRLPLSFHTLFRLPMCSLA